MSRARRLRRAGVIASSAAAFAAIVGATIADASPTVAPQPLAVPEFAARAGLVFKGVVTRLEYKEAETVPLLDDAGRPVVEESGRPVLVDGSGLPHTLVTYRVERTYKGKVDGSQVTLRFLGGPSSRRTTDGAGPLVLEVGHTPLFDVGDRDVLFVDGNTDKICPLTRCEAGRFRLIGSGPDRRVFSDQGNVVVEYADPSRAGSAHPIVAGIGPRRSLTEVTSNKIGDVVYQQEQGRSSEASSSEPKNVRGRPFTEASFDQFVTTVIRKTHTQRQLDAVPATPSADARQPIMPDPLTDAAPRINPEEETRSATAGGDSFEDRPAEERAALVEADRLEREALKANGGNPVLPRRGN